MLTELKVTNFAIIDQVNVMFRPGFNVLSGETGSGKSILLKSLSLLMGEKSASDFIKFGAKDATVEGSFDLSRRPDIKARLMASGISGADDVSQVDDQLIVKRIIANDGKNRVYIDGSLSTLQQLREIVAPLIELTGHNEMAHAALIEMTGQHENRNLQSKSFHLDNLDYAIGTFGPRQQLSTVYEKYARATEELSNLRNRASEREQRLDFLTFQRDEIRAVDLQVDSAESLFATLQLQKDSKRLVEFIDSAESALASDDDSASIRLHRILQQGQTFAGHNDDLSKNNDLSKNLDSLAQAKSLIEDAVYQLRQYGEKLSQDPAALEELENRVSQIRKLQKKYGGTTESVLQALARIETEISQIERADGNIQTLEKQVAELTLELKALASELHRARQNGAKGFAKDVNHELTDLNMKGILFRVRIDELSACTPTGISDVEFQIQNSKDDQPRSLAKFASGGELSRILLALKRVTSLAHTTHHQNKLAFLPQTFIFDEVDAGVSGVTAEKVGRKLADISKGQQVICVTHLPQVAAFADTHFVIAKIPGARTSGVKMTIDELSSKARVQEIARMLSGEKITKSSVEHASELLNLT